MNPASRGQERYRQTAKSITGKSAVTESIQSTFRMSNFPGATVQEPKRVTVSKPAPSDTKLEGFSLAKSRVYDTGLNPTTTKPIEDDFINNLQQQIYLTEMEIKLLKDQEVARANKFMGGLDAGPLTENLVMLKGKYKKIQEDLQGKIDELSSENRELQAKNSTANINYTRFIEDIKDFENKLAQERDFFDKESEKYRKAISTTTFFKEENAKILSDSSKARDMAKAYTGETRIKIERQGTLILSLEDKLSQAENFKVKIIEEKNKQIISLQEKLFRLKEDVKNSSTLGIVQEKLTFLNANKQEVEMERDNLVNRIKTLKQSKAMIEKAAAQLQLDKRALINQVEECKMEMDREKSQQELILNQKMRQKEDKELKTNISLLEDIRMENEYVMSLLKELISNNTELAEERTQLHYDIEELKEKKEM
jgi:hypothetical protein